VTRRDGLIDNEVWYYGSVDIDQSGVVYYGTAKGVAIYDPEMDYRNVEPPMVIIEKVVTEEEQGERNQFTFHYSALSFGNERGISYQTRLLGFEDEWSSMRDQTRINYTNLPAVFLPKEYTFEVRAVNESNIASLSPATYSFFVSPPMLLQWWAFLLYTIVLISGVWTVDRYQRKRLVQKEREKVREKELEQAKSIEEAYKKLEVTHQNLKAAQDQLVQQEKLASLGQLTAGIAHEIKNPLNFVNNFSELSVELIEEIRDEVMAYRNVPLQDQGIEEILELLKGIEVNLKTIHKHGSRADSIVKSMLEHSRGGSGKMEPTNLNALVKEFVNLTFHGMRANKDAINVDIVYQLDENTGTVPLIAEDFSRVVINLTNNAFDAMREKLSTFSDQASDDYEPELTVRTKAEKGEVFIDIEDNGPGIPKEVKDKILQPFFTTKKGTQGTGLGLSITNDIIKAHGGNLTINTTPHKGSTFRISIPR
jgi:signal transduction histidine kinase